MKFETFCAANSGDGFISFFDTLLDEKNMDIYYIKGGPGCGKSTLMKQIASKAETAELIRCSGDPASLDGIVLPCENAIVIDATAPHSHEPRYPGVGGNIIDLGIVWDPQKMNKERIIRLCDRKKFIYNECYSLLKSAKSLSNVVISALMKNISLQRTHRLGEKILQQNGLWERQKQRCEIKKRFLSAISPDGLITNIDTILKCGKNVILIDDRWMISDTLLSYIHQLLSERGIDHICSHHPLLGKNILHHIIVPDAHLSIVTRDGIFDMEIPEENIVRKISFQNAVDKEYLSRNKNKLSFIKKLEKEILSLAVERLEEARKTHMEIEAEYALGTNFEKAATLKETFISKLFE